MTTAITDDVIKNFTIVIVTELLFPMSRIIEINELCRKQAPMIGFIFTLTLGLYGFTFVDFGPKFIVKDTTGENTSSFVVVLVTNAKEGVVRIHDEKRHMFNDGDFVKLREVEGMTELNTADPMPIKVLDKFSFSIGDTTKFKEYTR